MYLNQAINSIKELTGIGPKSLESYGLMGVNTFRDLISMAPRGYDDRSRMICIGQQTEGGPWTNTIVCVENVSEFGAGRKNIKARVRDVKSGVSAFIMGFNRPYLKKVLYSGCYYHLYADVTMYKTILQCSRFEIERISENSALSGISDMVVDKGILPVYQTAGSLTQNAIRRDIKNALSFVKIDDDIPSSIMKKYSLMPLDSALRKIHFPSDANDIIQANRTLAFREMFFLQLTTKRRGQIKSRNSAVDSISALERNFIADLPFSLTEDQQTVLNEIRKDMASSESMNRLLQGDVGSGKTLVAWISALHIINSGGQVAFMAPTELLARQHAQNAAKLLEKTGISIAYLDGEVKGKQRTELLKQLENGNVDLLIGTHSLFSKDVTYRNLRYVIIDEQHRFGVEQRNSLFAKGVNPDILLMTATPIPRTLALTVFGNLNVSTIRTMPSGRIPIVTYLVDEAKRQSMYQSVGVELERGHQAYFVYPRIDNEGDSNLPDVQSMFTYLHSVQYPQFKGAIIHSRIEDEEKIRILNDFADGKIQYLVATSVVEVGLDVPNATCMIVEHADRFGLSALHQLRGRVGRSNLQSWCFMAFSDEITDDGKKRLSVLKRTNDGFEISEEDLKIRGPGEIAGLRQSGFLNLKYADLQKDISLMACARDEVESIIKEDPGLLSLENSVIRQNL